MSDEKRNYGQELQVALADHDVESQLDIVKDFVRNVLEKGVDYGEIPKIPTPSLFKGGAEKLIALFGAKRKTAIVSQEADWDRSTVVKKRNYNTGVWEENTVYGFLSYVVETQLLDARGNHLGSGLGASCSFEKKFASQGGGADTQNSLIKIAEKRSMVDAALTLSLVSGMFTQDVEDMDLSGKDDDAPKARASYTAPPAAGTVDENENDWVVEFGQEQYKGKLLSSLPPASIKFYAGAVQKNIDAGKFVEKNKKVLAKIQKVAAELGVAL